MYISGGIGISILKKDNKIILLIADDHSNEIYCNSSIKKINSNNHIDIKNFLKNEIEIGSQILLEEVPRGEVILDELWPNSPHTQDLKNLFLSNDKVNPLDIRVYLLPFSWELVGKDQKLGNFFLLDYIKLLSDFFNLKGKFYQEFFEPTYQLLMLENKGLGNDLINLKKKFNVILKFAESNNKPLSYFFYKNKLILDKISDLVDMIMEFYVILNCLTHNKKSIVHTGLYHSSRILEQLENIYDFKVIYKNGQNDLNINKELKSCIYVPKYVKG